MFTGIIEEIGRVINIHRAANSFKLSVEAHKVLADVKIGDSIAVNGVCLTVVAVDANMFKVDVMPETVEKTTLKHITGGNAVNLERALRLTDRLGGHLVQGHVDAIGIIVKKDKLDIAIIYRINAPASLLKYVVPKGSIAIDGISLTVIDVFTDSFTVSLIPHTAGETTLGDKKTGDYVNVESDIIGRYVEKLWLSNETGKARSLTMGFLSENGFM